jgi:phospholipid/cholesterol/gamma-HCH transport system substrate-binding protein
MKTMEAKVGAFVVLCAVVLSATVYYVSYARFKGARVPFRAYLKDAEGIEPGTEVLFGGITVGKVTSVEPDKIDPTRIAISLDVTQGTPLNEKSVADVGSVSLMGEPVLAISTGSNDAPRLRPGAVIRSQETVSMDELQRRVATLASTAQTTLVAVGSDLNDLTGDTRKLLANLNDATDTTNRKHLAGILANTDTTVAQLSPQINQISEQVLKLTKNANDVVAKLGPTVDNVNATVSNTNETITALRGPSQADLAELQRTLVQTRELINSLQVVVRANTQNTTYTLENLRMATDNLNQLTESVKERPWSLVRIRQPKERNVPK